MNIIYIPGNWQLTSGVFKGQYIKDVPKEYIKDISDKDKKQLSAEYVILPKDSLIIY